METAKEAGKRWAMRRATGEEREGLEGLLAGLRAGKGTANFFRAKNLAVRLYLEIADGEGGAADAAAFWLALLGEESPGRAALAAFVSGAEAGFEARDKEAEERAGRCVLPRLAAERKPKAKAARPWDAGYDEMADGEGGE